MRAPRCVCSKQARRGDIQAGRQKRLGWWERWGGERFRSCSTSLKKGKCVKSHSQVQPETATCRTQPKDATQITIGSQKWTSPRAFGGLVGPPRSFSETLGASRALFGLTEGVLAPSDAFGSGLGSLHGPSWARLGGPSGRPGAAMGSSWALLGLSWAVLWSSWGSLGRSGGQPVL